MLVFVRALAVLAAGAELQRCLRRPLELLVAAMGAAAAIAGATDAAANSLGCVGSNTRGGLQVPRGKNMQPEKRRPGLMATWANKKNRRRPTM